jgi:hypothetical protein
MKTNRPKSRVSLAHVLLAPLALFAVACSPEVGSDAWCEKMKETHKADWNTNDATEFARSCVFK